MKSFLLISNEGKPESILLGKNIKEYLEKKNCKANIINGYAKRELVDENTDCIITLGGDGTLLKASKELENLNIPFIGINMGKLGFLADIEKNNIYEAMDKLIINDFAIEKRMMLKAEILRSENLITSDIALNDIVINRGNGLNIIKFNLYVNGDFLTTYNADGIIVSTPTGSTAYSMSAGGPIVKPSTNLIILTPICPHTLASKSVILDALDEVLIEVIENRKSEEFGKVYFDGEKPNSLVTGDKIKIKKAENNINLIKLSNLSFIEILNNKMNPI